MLWRKQVSEKVNPNGEFVRWGSFLSDWLPDRRHQSRLRVGVRVVLLRSIPQQESQPLSALQVLYEELSCDYLVLVSALSNAECAEDLI